jgi:hypothetical protein
MSLPTPDLAARYRIATIVAVVMMTSVLVYAGVVALLDRVVGWKPAASADPQFETIVRVLLTALAAAAFLGVPVAQRALLDRPPMPGDTPGLWLLKSTFITFAIAESAAIAGLVLFVVTADARGAWLLMGLALLAMVVWFPRRERWEAYERNLSRHRSG